MENAPSVPARKTYSSITAIPKRNRQNTAARSATDNISYVTLNIPPPPSKENLQIMDDIPIEIDDLPPLPTHKIPDDIQIKDLVLPDLAEPVVTDHSKKTFLSQSEAPHSNKEEFIPPPMRKASLDQASKLAVPPINFSNIQEQHGFGSKKSPNMKSPSMGGQPMRSPLKSPNMLAQATSAPLPPSIIHSAPLPPPISTPINLSVIPPINIGSIPPPPPISPSSSTASSPGSIESPISISPSFKPPQLQIYGTHFKRTEVHSDYLPSDPHPDRDGMHSMRFSVETDSKASTENRNQFYLEKRSIRGAVALDKLTIKDSTLTSSSSHKWIEDIPIPIDPEVEGMKFIDYAKKHFAEQVKKAKLQKKVISHEELISFDKKLTTPLHKIESRDLQKSALEMFEKIQSFMGDSKKVDQKAITDAQLQQFIEGLLKKPELQNEFYCQLIKQMTKNPQRESVTKGWHLFATAAACFIPPSKELLDVVLHWLYGQAFYIPHQTWFCLQSFQKAIALGTSLPRKAAPSSVELTAIRNFSPMLCRFSTIDGSKKAIYIDSFTSAQAAIQTFLDRIQLPFRYRDLFTCVIIAPDGSYREVGIQGRMSDTLKILELVCSNLPDNQDLYLIQSVFINRHEPIDSSLLNKLLFHQIKKDIKAGTLPSGEKDLIQLSGLEMQSISGDFSESKSIKYSQLIPADRITPQKPVDYWNKKISEAHFGYLGNSTEDAYRKYVALAQSFDFYGSFILDCSIVNKNLWKAVISSGNDDKYKVVVNEEGVSIYKKDLSSLILQFMFVELIQWKIIAENTQVELKVAGFTSTFIFEPIPSDMSSQIVRNLAKYANALLRRSKYAIAIADHDVPHKSDDNSDLLEFKKGAVIKLHSPDDGRDWEFGELDNKFGIFPSSLIRKALDPSTSGAKAAFASGAPPITIVSDKLQLADEVKEQLFVFCKNQFRSKKLENKFEIDLNQKLKYSTEQLTYSLLKLEPQENKIATDTFALILKYINKQKLKVITELFQKVQENSRLKNEVYCLLLKQTIGNYDPKTNRLCWEIFTMVSCAFSPSDRKLLEIIELYIEFQGINNETDQQSVCLARHALLQLTRRRIHGPRVELPSVKELEAIKQGSYYISVKVTLPGPLPHSQLILIDSCSSVREVTTNICYNNLRFSETDLIANFSLFYQVELAQKIHPVLLHPTKKLVDVIIQRERQQSTQGSSGGSAISGISKLAPSSISSGLPIQFELNVAFYCQQLFDSPQLSVDANLLNAIYFLFKDRFFNSEITLSLAEAQQLAIKIFHANSLETPHKLNLQQFFPKLILNKNPVDNLVQRLSTDRDIVHNIPEKDARLSFISTFFNLKQFLFTFFPILGKEKKSVNKKLGVSLGGIAVFEYINDGWSTKQQWPLNSITNIICDSFSATIVIGGSTKKMYPVEAPDTLQYCYLQYKAASELP